MPWLLRIFPSLRRLSAEVELLRSANQQLQQENLQMQDRLDAAMEDRKQLWTMTRESSAAKDYAYQTQINHLIQREGGGTPYPDAHSLPENVIPHDKDTTPIARRMMPGEIARLRTEKFIRSYAEDLAKKQMAARSAS